MAARQEWVNVTRTKDGDTVVRVTLMEGNRVVRYATKAYVSTVGEHLTEARTMAAKLMGEVA